MLLRLHRRAVARGDVASSAAVATEAAHLGPAPGVPGWPPNVRDSLTLGNRLAGIVKNGTDADALRAIEQWTSRVYGRPTEHVTTATEQPASLEALAQLTHKQRVELLRSVGEGKALRLVDPQEDEQQS